jgi:hypothetical protein
MPHVAESQKYNIISNNKEAKRKSSDKWVKGIGVKGRKARRGGERIRIR